LIGFFDQPGVSHHNNAAGKGDASLYRVDIEGIDAAGFDSPVSRIVEDKKGVSLSASSF